MTSRGSVVSQLGAGGVFIITVVEVVGILGVAGVGIVAVSQ